MLAVNEFICTPPPASSLDGIAERVAEWLFLGRRLILQAVSQNISFQVEDELERKMWDSLEDDNLTLLAPAYKETHSPWVLMLGFCGVRGVDPDEHHYVCRTCIEVRLFAVHPEFS